MKYYVECTVGDSYNDGTCERFYGANPFDTLEAAKEFTTTVNHQGASIWICEHDTLRKSLELVGREWELVP